MTTEKVRSKQVHAGLHSTLNLQYSPSSRVPSTGWFLSSVPLNLMENYVSTIIPCSSGRGTLGLKVLVGPFLGRCWNDISAQSLQVLDGERWRLWVAINGHSPVPDLENSISVFFYSEYLVRELRPSEEIVFYMFKKIYCLLPFKCLCTELLPKYLHNWTFYRSGGICSICLGRKM